MSGKIENKSIEDLTDQKEIVKAFAAGAAFGGNILSGQHVLSALRNNETNPAAQIKPK